LAILKQFLDFAKYLWNYNIVINSQYKNFYLIFI